MVLCPHCKRMLDMSRGHSVADADGILYHMGCYDAIYLGKPVVDLDNNEEIYPDGKVIPLRGPSTVIHIPSLPKEGG